MIEKKTYRYKAFGLNLFSDIEIIELDKSEGECDVRIVIGSVPKNIEKVLEDSDQYQLSKTEFMFDIKNIAKYYVIEGRKIVIEPYVEADYDSITVYLMGTAMGVLLIQRNLVAIHGSAVSVDHRALIITGDCGAGKTSLCSGFRKNGYGFLADDISALSLDKDYQPFVHPAFAQQRLCTDTAVKMGYDLGALKLASMEEDKYVVRLEENYIEKEIPLAAIVEISIGDSDEVELETLVGIEKIKRIEKNIYCGPLYDNIGFTNSYYQALLLIAKSIKFYCISRPKVGFTVDEQLRMIVTEMTGDRNG